MYGGSYVWRGYCPTGFCPEGVLSTHRSTHVTSLQWISHISRTLHIRLISMSMQLTQIIKMFSKCLN